MLVLILISVFCCCKRSKDSEDDEDKTMCEATMMVSDGNPVETELHINGDVHSELRGIR